MKQKVLIFFLALVFLFAQIGLVSAKGSVGGGARSSGSGSSASRSSGGYSGSSSSKSSGGPSGSSSKSSVGSSSSSSKSSAGSSASSSNNSGGPSSSSSKSSGGYSGSSTSKSSGENSSTSGGSSGNSSSQRSTPVNSSSGGSSGSSGVSSSGSSKSTAATSSGSSKTNTQKTTYMQDQYKKTTSQSNYTTYKQDLNDEQKKVYDSSFNNTYNVNSRMSFEDAMRTRNQRVSTYNSRPIIINVNTSRFGGPLSYGSCFVGPWDMWFLLRASDLFWYNHWNDIYPYRDYFDPVGFAQMEARVRNLELQNIARDSAYLDPNFDPDLQFSNDYLQKNMDRVYYTNKYPSRVKNPVATLIWLLIIVIVLVLMIRFVSKPKRRKTFDSRIY